MTASLFELFAPFPEATVEIRDLVTHETPERGGVRVAVQWLLRGKYAGAPVYGPVTGSDVTVLGASHFLVQNARITTEWRVYDELATLTQIVQARGDQP